MSKEKKFISIVVYCYNVEKYVKNFFDTVIPAFNKKFEKFEIICVNDASTDNTVPEIKKYFKDNSITQMVQIMNMSYFQGKEVAINAGRDATVGDFVYEFEEMYVDYLGDLVIDVYDKMILGYDIVVATNGKSGDIFTDIFYKIYNLTSNQYDKIGQETFKLISRRAINRINSMGDYVPYRKSIINSCGLKSYKIQYKAEMSVKIKRKNNEKRVHSALNYYILFTDFLEKVTLFMSVFFLVITVFMGCYLIYSIFDKNKIEGWLSTMSFMAFGFFGIFLFLAIIMKYLSLIIDITFKQKYYLVEGVEKINEN